MTSPLVTPDDVDEAARRLAGVAHRTPVVTSRSVDAAVGAVVRLKCENLQRTGSFKFRGAYNRIAQVPPADRHRGVLAFSSGNHAQGVALAARLLDVPATVVMPDDAPAAKRAATEAYGARVVTYERRTQDREEVTERLLSEGDFAALVRPFDDPQVIAGQGTVGLELLDQAPDVEAVLVPMSGGGLMSGIAVAVRSRRPHVRLVGVEPRTCDRWVRSLAAGHPVHVVASDTIADGLRVQQPGTVTWPLVRELVDEVVSVEDDEVLAAMRLLLERTKLLAEPSGAVPLAALLAGRVPALAGRRVAAVVSGGNVDLPVLASYLRPDDRPSR